MKHAPISIALILLGAAACTVNQVPQHQPPEDVVSARDTNGDDGRQAPLSSDADDQTNEGSVNPLATRTPPMVRTRPVAQSPYRFEILGSRGDQLATYFHNGRRYVLGSHGERYTIHIRNPTSSRVEAVVSVDGLDVVDGKRADYSKRGYILQPWSDVTIEGFRTSLSDVAAFRFSSVADSYASRTGDARNVGVIGVAFFPERYVPPPPPPRESLPEPMPPRDDGPASDRKSAEAQSPPAAAPRAAYNDSASSGGAPSSGGAAPASRAAPDKERKGLGTEFGERRDSTVEYTAFVRGNENTPAHVMSVRYNDRRGLIALGIRLDPYPPEDEMRLRETAEPFPAQHFASPPPPRYGN